MKDQWLKFARLIISCHAVWKRTYFVFSGKNVLFYYYFSGNNICLKYTKIKIIDIFYCQFNNLRSKYQILKIFV